MEEVPLSPSKLNSNLKSPSLRVRSPSAKSNIAISRGDDDSSIDDDRPKMCISDETTIKCVFNKKRLFGGSALAFVAVVVIMAVAIATTRSDGGSSNSMASVNSNAAVGTAVVDSATAPPPKVTPVTPVKQSSNFAFVAPKSASGAKDLVKRCDVTSHGKSGKSGSYCYSGKSGKSGGHGLINLGGNGSSGKSGKSGSYFPAQPTCVKSSGKSGKSGSNNQFWRDVYRVGSDAWYSSGKSGKSGAGYCTLSPENYQDKESTCVDSGAKDINNGCWAVPQSIDRVEKIKLDQPICASISKYGDDPLQDIDVYEFDVLCPGEHTIILRSTGVNPANEGLIGPYFVGFDVSRISAFVFSPDSACAVVDNPPQLIQQTGFLAEPGLPGNQGNPPTGRGVEGLEDAIYFDKENGIYAYTVNFDTCGSYQIATLATLLIPTLAPTCTDGTFNCDELGGFLYSIEVTEGRVKGNLDDLIS